jgi:hypothetical protein
LPGVASATDLGDGFDLGCVFMGILEAGKDYGSLVAQFIDYYEM